METATQVPKTRKGNRGSFVPGDPRIRPGPGRPKRTDEIKALEKLNRQQVNDALARLIGPSLQRMLKIVDKGGDPEAVKIALALLDRVAGAVPSAQYIAANISGGAGSDSHIVSADEIRSTVLGYAARLQGAGVVGDGD